MPEGIRTPDLRIRSPLLYPAELLALINGAGDGNRTHTASLEGWNSTIELHPRIYQRTMYYITKTPVCKGDNGIINSKC